MPFHIVPRTDLSLADLLELFSQGFYGLKTPHAGNAYPNNLAMAALGIPLLLVDQTVGQRDKNFHPHLVIKGGASEQVADPTRLTSHALVTRTSGWFPDRFTVGTSLADAHVQALRDAFPAAQIETTSARARRLANLILPMLKVMTDLAPSSWERTVGKEGVISQLPPPWTWSNVIRTGVHGISPDGCGWIIPNAWNILFDGVIGARLTGRDTVYALSGPDMIRYYRPLLPEIQAGYEAIRRRIDSSLPETLTMVMVPVADMRFVTVRRRAAALDRLVEAYLQLNAADQEAKARLTLLDDDSPEKAAAIKVRVLERAPLKEALCAAVGNCPEVLYEIKDANYLTQYDLLGGEQLYVHPWAVREPIANLTKALNVIRGHAPRV